MLAGRSVTPKANTEEAEMKEVAGLKSVYALEMSNLVDQNHQLQETVAEFEDGINITTHMLADAKKEKEAMKRKPANLINYRAPTSEGDNTPDPNTWVLDNIPTKTANNVVTNAMATRGKVPTVPTVPARPKPTRRPTYRYFCIPPCLPSSLRNPQSLIHVTSPPAGRDQPR